MINNSSENISNISQTIPDNASESGEAQIGNLY